MSAVPNLSRDFRPERGRALLLRCPACGGSLGALREEALLFESAMRCERCEFVMTHERGIWLALPEDRARYYERFIAEYQSVREKEGRASAAPSFYLALPYRDTTGKNQGQWNIRAQSYRYLERELLPDIDPRCEGLDILDLGAGNGWMSRRLQALGHRPLAVDLLVNEGDGLGAATHYLQELPTLFPRFRAELDNLPFEDNQFDCAIYNASFHYSENYARTLAETIRCLRRGGFVMIVDSPWYSREESGRQMLRERRAMFQKRFGFASDSLSSLEYLTDRRLRELEKLFGIKWQRHHPSYGIRWAMRPWIAKARGRREPSRFRIYVAQVTKR